MSEDSIFFLLVDYLLGGLLGLFAASLAGHFGFRSADRLPGESRKPHCFYCLKPLHLHEYFPILGWLLRFDMAKFSCPCGKRTGQWHQPVIEIIGFVMGASAVYVAGWMPILIPICIALGLLVAITFIDLAFGVIPDGLNILLGLLGVATLFMSGEDIYLRLIGVAGLLGLALILALGYSKFRGKEMLGLGDVKFFAAAGIWLPIQVIPWFLTGAGVLGVLLGVIWQRFSGSKEFPFAPALCLSLAGALYYQLYHYALMSY